MDIHYLVAAPAELNEQQVAEAPAAEPEPAGPAVELEKKRKESPAAATGEGTEMEPPKKKRAVKGEAKAWTVQDDVQLRDAITTALDCVKVSKNVKFSFGKATPSDVESRWKALLYDPILAGQLIAATLPQKVPRVVWSDDEIRLLEQSVGKPQYKAAVVDLLANNRAKFHWSRTPKGLEAQGYKLRRKVAAPPGTASGSTSVSASTAVSYQSQAEPSSMEDIVIDETSEHSAVEPTTTSTTATMAVTTEPPGARVELHAMSISSLMDESDDVEII